MSKSRAKSSFKVTIGSGNMKQQLQGKTLFAYTVLTFLAVLIVYVTTRDWKGFTAPEEVDLGAVRVPSYTCRRKHASHHHHH